MNREQLGRDVSAVCKTIRCVGGGESGSKVTYAFACVRALCAKRFYDKVQIFLAKRLSRFDYNSGGCSN